MLRAWGWKGKGNKSQVAVYTLDRGMFVAATDGLGAERHFYSELSLDADEETLDDKITAYESQLAEVLKDFRMLSDGGIVDASTAAELVTHLVVRNDHFRKATSAAAAMMFSQFAEELTNEEVAKTALGFAGESPSSKFNEMFGELWDEHGAVFSSLGFTTESLSQSAFGMIRENFASMYADFQKPLVSALTETAAKAPEKAAEAHKRSLAESLVPPIRLERLRAFDWCVYSSTKLVLLPDCVAVGVDGAGTTLPLMFADQDSLSSVFMPLTPDLMLAGYRRTLKALRRPGEVFAGCSWDFFVAPEKNEYFEQLRPKMRTIIAPFLEKTIRQAVSEAIGAQK